MKRIVSGMAVMVCIVFHGACVISEEIATSRKPVDVGTTGGVPVEPAEYAWIATASMNEARHEHTMTRLADGRILVAGGFGLGSPTNALATTEIWDPSTQTFTMAEPMKIPRARHTATLLEDGSVIITGGYDGKIETPLLEELYVPKTNTWLSAPTGTPPLMAVARMYHDAVKLPNGNVLVASGCCDKAYGTAGVYNPLAGTFKSTPPLSILHAAPTLTLLPDDRVLLVGNANLTVTELYDFQNGTWSTSGKLNTPRNAHSATWMPELGKLVVAGGDSLATRTNTVESYDPTTGAWTSEAPLTTASREHTGTRITLDGEEDIVWVGGTDVSEASLDRCERWSGKTCPALNVARSQHRALVVSVAGGERVMVTGGKGADLQPTNSVEMLFLVGAN